MVRIGEYSPNFRGNRPVEGASGGIFGEYEERRKYYNEQRKIEYKQYLAQKALSATCHSETKSTLLSQSQASSVSLPQVNISSKCDRKEVATQTMEREKSDASTNTDGSSCLNTVDSCLNGQCSKQRDAYKGSSSLLKDKDNYHLLDSVDVVSDLPERSSGRTVTEKSRCEMQTMREGLCSLLRENEDHHHSHSVGVSGGRGLCDKTAKKGVVEKLAIREQNKSQDFGRVKECRRRPERGEEKKLKTVADKNFSITNVLSQLGEVRRQLATKQIEMEEALKKSKLNDVGFSVKNAANPQSVQ